MKRYEGSNVVTIQNVGFHHFMYHICKDQDFIYIYISDLLLSIRDNDIIKRY